MVQRQHFFKYGRVRFLPQHMEKVPSMVFQRKMSGLTKLVLSVYSERNRTTPSRRSMEHIPYSGRAVLLSSPRSFPAGYYRGPNVE